MKYYIIAGEASGDLHASNLMKSIKKNDAKAEIRAWGGDLMEQQGAELVKHYRDLAFMGFSEVIFNLKTILTNISFCKKDILAFKPDVLILVDYPGFNLRIAEFAKKEGIKVIYYISPQIWAWKKNRVHSIKKYVDKMMVILPFEKDFYAKYNFDVDFVGHPLLDSIDAEKFSERNVFLKQNNLPQKPIIALLPGSRKQEVSAMLKVMLAVEKEFSNYQFVIAGVDTLGIDFYESSLHNSNAKVLFGHTHNIVSNAAAALVTSGTATLETAIIGTPEVVCYRGNWLSVQIAKRIVEIKYISLVNLIMDKLVVTELIQSDLNKNNLILELNKILPNGKNRNAMLNNFDLLRQKLGNNGASDHAAKLINDFMSFHKDAQASLSADALCVDSKNTQ